MADKDIVDTRKEYNALFKGHKRSRPSNKSKSEKALKYALDIRKFEIDLYWKRAAYFWAFITAITGGFFWTLRNGSDIHAYVFANIGFIFSLAWYLVNKGSKYWQANWEQHVDVLEDEHIGPLYTLVKCQKTFDKKQWNKRILNEGRYSVSKINQAISFYVTILWGGFIILTVSKLIRLGYIIHPNYLSRLSDILLFIFVTILLVYMCYLLLIHCNTDNSLTRDKEKCMQTDNSISFQKRGCKFKGDTNT